MKGDKLDDAFGRAIAAAFKDSETVAHVFVAVINRDGVVGSGSTLDEVHQMELLRRMLASLEEGPEVQSLWVNRKTGEMRESDPEKQN